MRCPLVSQNDCRIGGAFPTWRHVTQTWANFCLLLRLLRKHVRLKLSRSRLTKHTSVGDPRFPFYIRLKINKAPVVWVR